MKTVAFVTLALINQDKSRKLVKRAWSTGVKFDPHVGRDEACVSSKLKKSMKPDNAHSCELGQEARSTKPNTWKSADAGFVFELSFSTIAFHRIWISQFKMIT